MPKKQQQKSALPYTYSVSAVCTNMHNSIAPWWRAKGRGEGPRLQNAPFPGVHTSISAAPMALPLAEAAMAIPPGRLGRALDILVTPGYPRKTAFPKT